MEKGADDWSAEPFLRVAVCLDCGASSHQTAARSVVARLLTHDRAGLVQFGGTECVQEAVGVRRLMAGGACVVTRFNLGGFYHGAGTGSAR